MSKYKYVGTVEIVILNMVVKPGQTIDTDKIINHPLFQVVHNKKRS